MKKKIKLYKTARFYWETIPVQCGLWERLKKAVRLLVKKEVRITGWNYGEVSNK